MKKQFNKGDYVAIMENGQHTQMSVDLDIDRELAVNDIFVWHNRITMRVLSIDYPLTVEELD